MARLDQTYVADDLPKSDRNFEPLPAGWYAATISEADIKKTKAGTGSYIKMRLDVTGPSHQGRVLFSNINLRNPNPKAEEIGAQQLGELMRAVGLPRLEDTDQLVGRAVSVKVTVKESEQYGTQNEVKAYKSASGAAAAPTTTTATSAAAKTPPWGKK
jgi:hypothetical protein